MQLGQGLTLALPYQRSKKKRRGVHETTSYLTCIASIDTFCLTGLSQCSNVLTVDEVDLGSTLRPVLTVSFVSSSSCMIDPIPVSIDKQTIPHLPLPLEPLRSSFRVYENLLSTPRTSDLRYSRRWMVDEKDSARIRRFSSHVTLQLTVSSGCTSLVKLFDGQSMTEEFASRVPRREKEAES